jgi:hypothetical protein
MLTPDGPRRPVNHQLGGVRLTGSRLVNARYAQTDSGLFLRRSLQAFNASEYTHP